MTLDNLVSIGRLQRIEVDDTAVRRLLAAATRNLEEVALQGMSPDTRFDLAYKCILKVAMAGLAAKGFRTSQNQPGHHLTALQCLGWTLGVPGDLQITLDALRKQRNVSDYSGDPVTDQIASACAAEAKRLVMAASTSLCAGDTHTETFFIAKGPEKAARLE